MEVREQQGEEEAEARTRFCRLMISRLRDKRHSEKTAAPGRGRPRTEAGEPRDAERKPRPAHSERQGGFKPCAGAERGGPEVQTVPLQLISTLRLRRLGAEMERAAEVELHHPTGCRVCEQDQDQAAAVALNTFIWRKKTQLQMRTVERRQNTELSLRVRDLNTSPSFPPPHTP